MAIIVILAKNNYYIYASTDLAQIPFTRCHTLFQVPGWQRRRRQTESQPLGTHMLQEDREQVNQQKHCRYWKYNKEISKNRAKWVWGRKTSLQKERLSYDLNDVTWKWGTCFRRRKGGYVETLKVGKICTGRIGEKEFSRWWETWTQAPAVESGKVLKLHN